MQAIRDVISNSQFTHAGTAVLTSRTCLVVVVMRDGSKECREVRERVHVARDETATADEQVKRVQHRGGVAAVVLHGAVRLGF